MVSADSPFAFLRTIHPHDQVTYWIGAIMREAAQLELTCMLMVRAILQNQQAELDELDKKPDWALGAFPDKLGTLLARDELRCVAPDLSREILDWAAGNLTGLNRRRNRVAHDVFSGDGTGVALVRYGSSSVFSHEPRDVVTESLFVDLRSDLERVRREAEDLWSRADAGWRE